MLSTHLYVTVIEERIDNLAGPNSLVLILLNPHQDFALAIKCFACDWLKRLDEQVRVSFTD